MNATPAHLTGIRTVSIPVDDLDAAIHLYTDTLGLTLLRDNPTPDGGRWIELAVGSDNAVVTLEPAQLQVTRRAIGIGEPQVLLPRASTSQDMTPPSRERT